MRSVTMKMPKGVGSLYFIQAFSTFSFAIMYSSLALYITREIGLSNTLGNSIVGLFLTFNYVLQLIGGILGGRYLSNRVLFFCTIIVQSTGLVLLSQAQPSLLYAGLSLFIIGAGLNTTSYNNILTQRFKPKDERRENAFFLSYAAMNLGFCAGYITSGFFDYSSQYHYLFYASMITNVITLLLMAKNWSNLNDSTTLLAGIKIPKKLLLKKIQGMILILILIPTICLGFLKTDFTNGLIVILSLFMFCVIITLALKQKSDDYKHKIMAYLILALCSLLFWMIYLTGPMGITLFIKNNVDKSWGDFVLATQWIRNINPLAIMIGAPLMTMLINKAKARGYNISITVQFNCAFVFLALSFLFLSCGIIFSDNHGFTHLYWIIAHLIMQGMAELFIGPAGYAMIGRIAPPHLQGILMGTWMLISGTAASFSQYLSNAMIKSSSVEPLITNHDYLAVFEQLGIWSLSCAVVLYFIAPKIMRLIENPEIDKSSIVTAYNTL